jgi:hypothetical protein
MNIQLLVKVFSVALCLGGLFLAGCANFLKPEIGAIARPEARIILTEGEPQDVFWQTKDLELSLSIVQTGNSCNLSGELSFDRSLTDSFPVIKSFILKMSFLDSEGRVIEAIDITPFYSYFNHAPDRLRVKASCVRPAAAAAIAFNYFGSFRGNAVAMGGDEWDIFYFPFD